MKSLTDLQWYDQNGNLVKSYDKNTNAGPSILYFDGVSEKPVALQIPVGPDTSKPYLFKMVYDSVNTKWNLEWVKEVNELPELPESPVTSATYVLTYKWNSGTGWELSWEEQA